MLHSIRTIRPKFNSVVVALLVGLFLLTGLTYQMVSTPTLKESADRAIVIQPHSQLVRAEEPSIRI